VVLLSKGKSQAQRQCKAQSNHLLHRLTSQFEKLDREPGARLALFFADHVGACTSSQRRGRTVRDYGGSADLRARGERSFLFGKLRVTISAGDSRLLSASSLKHSDRNRD
jgi:hypothetical protein